MNNYWGYLCNPCTGRFKEKFAGRFFDKNNKEINHSDVEAYKKLLKILPNDTLKFNSEHNKRNLQLAEIGIPIEPIFFFEYLHNNYRILW